MPLIVFKPAYKGHRAMVVPRAKALEIQAAHRNPTGDMSEEQLDMLRHIDRIYIAPERPTSHTAPVQQIFVDNKTLATGEGD